MDRRRFIKSAGIVLPIAGILPASALEMAGLKNPEVDAQPSEAIRQNEVVDYTIHIETGLIVRPGPNILFQQPLIMDNFQVPCCDSGKDNEPLWTFTTTPIRRSSFIGTDSFYR